MLRFAILFLACASSHAALADGVLSCRWQSGTTAIAYAASGAQGELATDVRALVQGAPLVDAAGGAPRFATLTPSRPEHATEPLLCAGGDGEPADGMIELTFARKVRLGIEYTLAKCQLFYRCAAGAAAVPPQLYLGFVGGGAPTAPLLPSAPPAK